MDTNLLTMSWGEVYGRFAAIWFGLQVGRARDSCDEEWTPSPAFGRSEEWTKLWLVRINW